MRRHGSGDLGGVLLPVSLALYAALPACEAGRDGAAPGGGGPPACAGDLDCALGDPCSPRRCLAGVCVAAATATACDHGRCDGEAVCVAPCEDPGRDPEGRCGEVAPCPLAIVPRLPWLPASVGLPLRWAEAASHLALEVALDPEGGAPGDWHPLPLGSETLHPPASDAVSTPLRATLRLRLQDPPMGCEAVEFRHALTLVPASPEGQAATLAASHAGAIIGRGDPRIGGWATDWLDYTPGESVDTAWQEPRRSLGASTSDGYDVLPLGEGGTVTLPTPWPLHDADGPELAVFENANPAAFVELAFVEVSSDGHHFARFDTLTLVAEPVHAYGTMDPTRLAGFAGAAPLGSGVAFDLAALRDHPLVRGGFVDLDAVRFVRVVDVPGDGRLADSLGQPIFDPYPTFGSAGFDLDAVGFLSP
jgi:hypothetical protein